MYQGFINAGETESFPGKAYRAVATGPVSPVSTGPLFPSPMACLASPNRANAQRTPMARTQRGDMLKNYKRWLRTVWKNFFGVFQQLSILPSERLVSQALSAKGVACENSERSESRNQCYMAQRAERVDIYACKTLSSGLRETSFWSKNGLRSNLIASKFQKFSGGACPQTPLAVACLRTHRLRTHH